MKFTEGKSSLVVFHFIKESILIQDSLSSNQSKLFSHFPESFSASNRLPRRKSCRARISIALTLPLVSTRHTEKACFNIIFKWFRFANEQNELTKARQMEFLSCTCEIWINLLSSTCTTRERKWRNFTFGKETSGCDMTAVKCCLCFLKALTVTENLFYFAVQKERKFALISGILVEEQEKLDFATFLSSSPAFFINSRLLLLPLNGKVFSSRWKSIVDKSPWRFLLASPALAKAFNHISLSPNHCSTENLLRNPSVLYDAKMIAFYAHHLSMSL